MATIDDVAKAAGVSISTVSYAISGKRSISESTKERVTAAIRALDYRPNAGARMLAGMRTNILGLAAPLPQGTHTPSHMVFVLSVGAAARDLDYDVLLLTREEALSGLRRVSATSLVDGIIMMDVSTDDERTAVIRDLGTPTTWIGIPADATGLICVDLNFERAAELTVERLAGLGHRSVMLLGYPPNTYDRNSNFAMRFNRAFENTASLHSMTTAFRPSEANPESLRKAYEELREELPGASALVLHCTDPVPQMLLEILKEKNVSIPEELSLATVTSTFTSDPAAPAMDYIPWPAEAVSRRAVALMVEQLTGEVEPHVELLEPTYVPMGTTAPPREQAGISS